MPARERRSVVLPLLVPMLIPRPCRFVFEGLPQLADSVLVAGARHIALANEHGIRKIFRDIITTQQGLRMLAPEGAQNTELTRAKQYYALYALPPPVSRPPVPSVRVADRVRAPGHDRGCAAEAGVQLRRVQHDAEPQVRRRPVQGRGRRADGGGPQLQHVRH
jgi:hypothetical protein